MKIIIACDSFKGCLSAKDVCNSIKQGVLSSNPSAEVIAIPMADGGEGTADCFFENCGGIRKTANVSNPLFNSIRAEYVILKDNTAVIETAAASGITLLKKDELNPLKTTTLGTGELIAAAVKNGAEKLILGLGGSATNDGGMGALSALGVQFLDNGGNLLSPIGENMARVKEIHTINKFNKYKNLEITLACDVENPFYGKSGAAHIFAAQKGADEKAVNELDVGLKNLARVYKAFSGIDLQNIKGSGAAGGLCGGLYALLNCKIESGFTALQKEVDFKAEIKDADLIITGEGKTDSQTSFGKLPKRVADMAKENNIDCILLSGDIEKGIDTEKSGFKKAYKIKTDEMPLEYAIKNASVLLKEKTEDIIRGLDND